MADAAGITRRNGLKVDLAAQAAWQRRSAQRYAANQRARKKAARLASVVNRKTTSARNANDWPASVRKLAAKRSGGICEVCLTDRAGHLHHRKSRRHRDHRIVNALHVCVRCHRAIHATDRAAAYVAGYLVRSGDDPAKVAVTYAGDHVLPTQAGSWRRVA